MNFKDIFWLGYKELREKKVRTALTVIMVVIGVASIVALVSQVDGISASISTELSSLGPTSIILTTTKATGFTATDLSNLQSIPNVSSVTPIVEGSGSAYANGQNVSVTVIGISPSGLQEFLGNTTLYEGSMYNNTLSPSSVIGYSVAFPSSLGGAQNVKVGQPVVLHISGGASRSGSSSSSITVPVTGIVNQFGTSIVPIDTGIMMSVPEAEALLHRSSYSYVIVKASNISTVSSVSNEITAIYGTSVHVETTQQILSTVASIIGSISLLLGIVAGISLLVAAIGIMNIMLISVYERIHDIGIMKSIGFRSRDVLMIFLFQALIIGFLGGLVGIGVGAGASFGLSAILSSASSSTNSTSSSTSASSGSGFRSGAGGAGAGGGGAVFVGGGGAAPSSSSSSSFKYSPVITLGTALEALFVAVFVGVVAGIYPAWRASKLQPIDALRAL